MAVAPYFSDFLVATNANPWWPAVWAETETVLGLGPYGFGTAVVVCDLTAGVGGDNLKI